LVMVVGLLPTAAFAAGYVEINETNFPDAKFRSFVKENLDKNKDDILDAGEIAAVKMIEANKMGIKSLEGVGFFTALETLKCWDNELTGLDLSKNTALKNLQCSNSKLQSLDLSQNPNLTQLYCGRNPLTTLDLSKNAKLKVLNCSGFANRRTKLTELDLSQNTALESLDCSINELKQLNVSGCTALKKLSCSSNQLTTLDVSKNVNLTFLNCGSNQLTALDVSNNPKLEDLSCDYNSLTLLDLSKNPELEILSCRKNGFTSLDLDANKKIGEKILYLENQFYHKGVLNAGETFDMKTLPGSFDPSRTKNWIGGTVDAAGILTVDADATEVTYDYQTKSGNTDAKYLMSCKLNVKGSTTPVAKYAISVTGGIANLAKAAEGSVVTLTADTPAANMHFARWEVESGSEAVTFANATNSTTTFPMPAGEVKVKAVFEADEIMVPIQYDVSVLNDGNGKAFASPAKAAADTAITLTATPNAGYHFKAWRVILGGVTITDNKFTMPAEDVEVQAVFEKDAPISKHPFLDVPAGAYYEDAVVWAVGKGITSGTNATTFDPNGTCTRAQAVTFLWRAAGSPTPKTKLMPFPDVPVGSYYWNAVLWAIEQGITEGTSYLTFSPNDSCTRAQIVTFLWRAKGNPAVSGNAPFTDVAPDAYYAAAVTWAEKNGITGGIGNGLFGSNNTCTRAQIVTFLYRAMK
ncbi:InlB B-repeat-containing protein, partial [Dysosmobacter sp.]|uniref:InlB B-repeat-containing protein n=1 Tax=Dysosmobacter sp. TaxID=2591382 RepID=UPI003A92A092